MLLSIWIASFRGIPENDVERAIEYFPSQLQLIEMLTGILIEG
jgi:hypothetical protein